MKPYQSSQTKAKGNLFQCSYAGIIKTRVYLFSDNIYANHLASIVSLSRHTQQN